ncbi:hypothetical protein ElyMa_004198700 [Elysia marginata]|uniref:Uncharacterized protein n=1 Tax=Elysia marginata TaxID=1093978 RepID=A0AAV4GMA2_9GAST|nr:hypothetical protein ElyMa_004198700 [Elysia marginata]
MPDLRSGNSTSPSGENMEPQAAIPAVSQVVVMERERRITKFYGDDASLAAEFEEEVKRAWAAAHNLNATVWTLCSAT